MGTDSGPVTPHLYEEVSVLILTAGVDSQGLQECALQLFTIADCIVAEDQIESCTHTCTRAHTHMHIHAHEHTHEHTHENTHTHTSNTCTGIENVTSC